MLLSSHLFIKSGPTDEKAMESYSWPATNMVSKRELSVQG